MFKPLPRAFYDRSAQSVAPLLLGKWLVRNTPQGWCGGPIVETEAYLENDPACHSFGGRTARNQTMWGPPGHAYVYLIYGYHFCVNAVCSPQGKAEAVLIRALEPALGEDWMRKLRKVSHLKNLTSGPARLCQALGIDRSLDGVDLCDSESSLFIAENLLEMGGNKAIAATAEIVTTTRIGISKAADLPLRFYLDQSFFVSKRRPRPKP